MRQGPASHALTNSSTARRPVPTIAVVNPIRYRPMAFLAHKSLPERTQRPHPECRNVSANASREQLPTANNVMTLLEPQKFGAELQVAVHPPGYDRANSPHLGLSRREVASLYLPLAHRMGGCS
jgi:hypothetical protein